VGTTEGVRPRPLRVTLAEFRWTVSERSKPHHVKERHEETGLFKNPLAIFIFYQSRDHLLKPGPGGAGRFPAPAD
jgi:hypothetical protein